MSTTSPSTKPEVEPEAQSGDDQEQMERENQETNTGTNAEFSEVKEQDRWLPIANGNHPFFLDRDFFFGPRA